MPTLLVGYETSFVGEAVVGGPAAFTSTGEITLFGAATNKKVANKTSTGIVLLEGTASHIQGRLYESFGAVEFSGAAGKSVSIGSAGTLELGGTAAVDYVGVSHVAKSASGSMEFSGACGFIRRTSWESMSGELVLEGAAARAISTNLATSGSVEFSGTATADLTSPYIATGAIILEGYASYTRLRNVLTSGTMNLSGVAPISRLQLGASVWSPEGNGATQQLVAGASVWQQTATAGGTIVGSDNIWEG